MRADTVHRILAVAYSERGVPVYAVTRLHPSRQGRDCETWVFNWCDRLGRLECYREGERAQNAVVVPDAAVYWYAAGFPGFLARDALRFTGRWQETTPTPESLFDLAVAADAVGAWCDECGDYQPRGEECHHVFWCERCGAYAGPVTGGCSRRCRHTDPRMGHTAGAARTAWLKAGAELIHGGFPWDWRCQSVSMPMELPHPFSRVKRLFARKDGILVAEFRRKRHHRQTSPDHCRWVYVLYDALGNYTDEFVPVKEVGKPLTQRKPYTRAVRWDVVAVGRWADERLPVSSIPV